MVIGLGAILGKMLEVSGGADVIAERIARTFGAKRADWAVLTAAIVIGIPVFFSVGFMLLLPIVFAMSRRNSIPFMKLGIPLAAALSSMHACVPPSHPGASIAVSALHADLAKTVLYSLIAGIPMAAIVGIYYARWILPRMEFDDGLCVYSQSAGGPQRRSAPGFGVALSTILLPILLVLLAKSLELALPESSAGRAWLKLLGEPTVAMLIAVLASFYSFGVARGFSAADILKFSNDCMTPIAATLLVVGAGGGFNQILKDCRITDAIVHFAGRVQLPVLVLGWLVAALIRIAVGSSTVAITTAVGIVGPLAAAMNAAWAAAPGTMPRVNIELLAVAMGAGSLMLSHVNDGGFWIVKEFFGISVEQTFKTWSVGTCIGSVAGLLVALVLQAFV
jgi:GntP family gluconate:H+ symporter